MLLLIINIVLGIVFISLGFLINERNAASILSNMDKKSLEENKNFLLSNFVLFFRQFHFVLGGSFIVFAIFFYLFWGEDALGMLLAFYPILAYLLFIVKAKRFYSGNEKMALNIAFWGLIITGISIGLLLFAGNNKSDVIFEETQFKITGMYGENISYLDIDSIQLVEMLPVIAFKTNGFALKTIKKGYFKLKNGEKVKLILNSMAKPYLYIKLKSGRKIYFSTSKEINKAIYHELMLRKL